MEIDDCGGACVVEQADKHARQAIAEGGADRQEGDPLKDVPPGAHDQNDAHEADDDREPANGTHMLAQYGYGQRRDEQGAGKGERGCSGELHQGQGQVEAILCAGNGSAPQHGERPLAQTEPRRTPNPGPGKVDQQQGGKESEYVAERGNLGNAVAVAEELDDRALDVEQ